MAITISQGRKKQSYLTILLIVLLAAILLVVWFGFLRKKEPSVEPSAPAIIYTIQEVKIDWQILEELRKETAQPFKEISSFGGKFGRNNPFAPY